MFFFNYGVEYIAVYTVTESNGFYDFAYSCIRYSNQRYKLLVCNYL